MDKKRTAFQASHMDELRRLGMGGYPCATYAAQEIEQLNDYVFALEVAFFHWCPDKDRALQMIEELRELFAPDVDLPARRRE